MQLLFSRMFSRVKSISGGGCVENQIEERVNRWYARGASFWLGPPHKEGSWKRLEERGRKLDRIGSNGHVRVEIGERKRGYSPRDLFLEPVERDALSRLNP